MKILEWIVLGVLVIGVGVVTYIVPSNDKVVIHTQEQHKEIKAIETTPIDDYIIVAPTLLNENNKTGAKDKIIYMFAGDGK